MAVVPAGSTRGSAGHRCLLCWCTEGRGAGTLQTAGMLPRMGTRCCRSHCPWLGSPDVPGMTWSPRRVVPGVWSCRGLPVVALSHLAGAPRVAGVPVQSPVPRGLAQPVPSPPWGFSRLQVCSWFCFAVQCSVPVLQLPLWINLLPVLPHSSSGTAWFPRQ